MEKNYGQFLETMKTMWDEGMIRPSVAINLSTMKWQPTQLHWGDGYDAPFEILIYGPIPHNDNEEGGTDE